MRHVVFRTLLVSATLVVAPSASAQTPSDADHKTVTPYFEQRSVSCPSGAILTRTVEGTITVIEPAGGRFERVIAYNRTWTFANTAGDTYVLQEAGVDRHWIEGGDNMVGITGKTPIFIGLQVFNLSTGELVFEGGRELDVPRLEACARLG